MKKKLLLILACILVLAVATPVSAISTMGSYTVIDGVSYQPGDEITELRDQYSTTRMGENGNVLTTISLGSINYETTDGDFYPIQTNIVPSSKPNWDWEVEAGHWQLYVNNDMTIQVVKNDNIIGHQLYGIAYYDQSTKQYRIIQTTENRIPTVTGNEILWKDVLYGVDYVIHYTNDSFKEDIIIKQALRELLNTPGYTPTDYGLNPSVTYLMPIFRMDWSNALPMKLKNGNAVNKGNSEHEENIHFRSSVKDQYFNTNLVSYMPVDYATSVNPINPEDPEDFWDYKTVKIQKRLVTSEGSDWLLAGIKFDALNKMPVGTVVFDPTETLRPDGAGSQTSIFRQDPDSGSHWDKVDEAVADDGTTYVEHRYSIGQGWGRDLYALPASSGEGVVTQIEVHIRGRESTTQTGSMKASIRTNGNTYDGSGHSLVYTEWRSRSEVWTENPYTETNFTWAEIDALEIGVSLYASWGNNQGECTQVYVVVSAIPFTAPTVTTQDVTNTDNESTTSHGTITYAGGLVIDYRGFVWDTSSHGDPGDTEPPATYADNITYSGNFTAGAFEGSITELTQAQTYYYRAFAHNSEGWSYGEEVTFITDDVPDITTNAATNVAYTTTRLNSTVVDDGGEACDVRFQYNTTADNFTMGDNTTWVEDTYLTGNQPYKDVIGLSSNTLYYFRAQIRNTYGTDNGTALTFTTPSDIFEPTNFKAFPEAERITLSWTKGGGSTNTHVRIKEGSYPTAVADGNLVYNDTLSSTAAEDLTPGTTYYFSAWGLSGGTYSDNYTTVMATTLAMETDAETPEAPGDLPTWFQSPDHTRLSGIPGYELINRWPDALNMQRATFWTFWILLNCILVGAIVFVVTNGQHPIPAVIAVGFSMTVFLAMEQLPLFMIVFVVMDIAGALALSSRH